VVSGASRSSGITASETKVDSGLPWNLASAGRYQDGKGLTGVKHLTKVTLEFGSIKGMFLGFVFVLRGFEFRISSMLTTRTERLRFVEYFSDLKELYMRDMGKKIGLPGT
jgi:hypothetical protein